MKPIQHSTNNVAFGAATNALPVTQTNVEGKPALISFWKPTPEELSLLMTGAPVALMVMGETMPTVSLAAVKA